MSPRSRRPIDQLMAQSFSWWSRSFTFIRKIKLTTAQGLLIVLFIGGTLIALLWAVALKIQTLSNAGTGGELTLDPPTLTVNQDQTFDLDLVVNTNSNDVVAAKTIVQYDPALFQLQAWDTSNSPFVLNNSCLHQGAPCELASHDTQNGRLTLTLAKPHPGINTASGIVATLTFKALGAVSPSTDNITLNFAGAGSYADSDVIADDGQGSDILTAVFNTRVTVNSSSIPPPPPPPPIGETCTDWTYSAWGVCQANGVQIRTILTSSPVGCQGGNPMLQQSCTPIPEPCTSFDYSNWSACQSDGTQTRTVMSGIPANCQGGVNPVLSQTCGFVPPVCTSFIYSAWGMCQPNGQQIRNIISSAPTNCEGGSPILTQSCTYELPVCIDFTYSDWGACQSDSTQTRTVLGVVPVGCTGGSPSTTQSCTYLPGGDPDGGTTVPGGNLIVTDKDRKITISGEKASFADGETIKTDSRRLSFSGTSAEVANGKVQVISNGAVAEEVSVGADGKWKIRIKVRDDGTFRYSIRYIDSAGQTISESDTYKIKVDTEDPTFSKMPLIVTKHPGDKVWWNGKDENGIDEYKYTFAGRIRTTERESFNISIVTPPGIYLFKVRAEDEFGNTATKRMLIRVVR